MITKNFNFTLQTLVTCLNANKVPFYKDNAHLTANEWPECEMKLAEENGHIRTYREESEKTHTM